jgi:hypothetical protein
MLRRSDRSGSIVALMDYVYSRPIGEASQETGGGLVTLAALCNAFDIDMHAAGETELARILQPETIAKIRAKQAAKPTGSALPVATPAPAAKDDASGAQQVRVVDGGVTYHGSTVVVYDPAAQPSHPSPAEDSAKGDAVERAAKALASHDGDGTHYSEGVTADDDALRENYRAAARAAMQAADVRNEWREAVLDALAIYGVDRPTTDTPAQVLQHVLTCYAQQANEPTIAAHPESAARQEAVAFNVPQGLDTCPITGRPFFMNMEHDELGYVATYGGPFDSYTIPTLDDDGESLRCERYDHDAGHWVEGGEPVLDVLTDDCKAQWIADQRAAPVAATQQAGEGSEVLIAITRNEDYADVHPQILAEDFVSTPGGFEWRVVSQATQEPGHG